MHRTLAMVKVFWIELLRSPASIFGALVLLLAIPAVALFVADTDENALWMSRFMFVEGTRAFVPILTIMGAAFLLRPRMARGWSTLPARRSEWLLACTLTAFTIVLAVNSLLFAGSMLAQSMVDANTELQVTSNAEQVDAIRKDGSRREGKPTHFSWMNPNYKEVLEFELEPSENLDATIHFEAALSNVQSPSGNLPFRAVGVSEDGSTTPLTATTAGQRKAILSGQGAFTRVQLIATDPGLIVGVTPEDVHITTDVQSPFISMLALFAVSLAGTLLLITGVYAVRSLSTAPTAALAGLFLFTAMTLLPALAPTTAMAKARAKAMMQSDQDATDFSNLESIPQVFPAHGFDEFLAGRVSGPFVQTALYRTAMALPLLIIGAILFRRRELAK
ncbi:hypothetical protein OAU50_00330 [Planctomycetota bacterium]|nr:hypothetical protein [Planctomycetota bacterium]